MVAGEAQAAEVQTFSGEYVVSYMGLTVARSTFSSRIEGTSFKVDGTIESAGFGRFFDDTTGKVTASGGFKGNRTEPTAFRVDYQQKEKSTVTTIDFTGGAVTATETIPAPKPRGSDWIPIDLSDLSRVSDPISATLIRADGPRSVCGRTVRVFDGEIRLDVALFPVGIGTADIPGQGETVTCRATIKPVSGYRKGRKALEYLQKKARIMVAFAELGKTGIYAPVFATVGTEIGTVSIKARSPQ